MHSKKRRSDSAFGFFDVWNVFLTFYLITSTYINVYSEVIIVYM